MTKIYRMGSNSFSHSSTKHVKKCCFPKCFKATNFDRFYPEGVSDFRQALTLRNKQCFCCVPPTAHNPYMYVPVNFNLLKTSEKLLVKVCCEVVYKTSIPLFYDEEDMINSNYEDENMSDDE